MDKTAASNHPAPVEIDQSAGPGPVAAPKPAPQDLLPECRLVDSFGRRLDYLRLSITDRCNLRCVYCMPAGGLPKLSRPEVLSIEELIRVGRVAVELGVHKIRLTGGEPLLRRGLPALLEGLAALDPRPDLRLTTNGLLLAEKLPVLLDTGVSTVNVSLDTLKPQRYGRITGLGPDQGPRAFHRVVEGIEDALKAGGLVVKLNAVLLAGINDDELADFARLTLDRPLAVRFIEYMPVGSQTTFKASRFLPASEAKERLGGLGEIEDLPARPGDGPAARFRLKGAKGELGVITAVTSHFCAGCNRIRVNAEGQVVPCLFAEPAGDLKDMLRRGATDEDISDALVAAAKAKPERHAQASGTQHGTGCQMSRLGG